MKKTSVYLDPEHLERLRWLAEREGRSQSDVLREAIMAYAARAGRERDFAMAGIGEGPGGSIADIPDEELLQGFGA
ncbi:MAG: Ribbon-helix-helix protein copG family [Chloroflexota bacterium]|jgi:predicted transcriptional regulator|nr:Ribbon-helix-helix protein copG family [Chloroflexota bacterium]